VDGKLKKLNKTIKELTFRNHQLLQENEEFSSKMEVVEDFGSTFTQLIKKVD
jgi:hypothetical protein